MRHVHLSSSVPVRVHSESLLSELDPLELLLEDSEELLLLSLDGPPEGAEPDLSFLVGFLLFSCPLTSCSRFSSSFFFSRASSSFDLPACFFPLVDNGFLCFFCKQDLTYLSSSRSVVGFRVSKSISISSGLESRSEGSRLNDVHHTS